MDSLKQINITLSFGTEGVLQETSGSLQNEGALPSPPEPGGPANEQSGYVSDFPLPPPPGNSSEDKSFSGFDDTYDGGGPPAPPGSGNKQSTGTQDMGPPEQGKNNGNTDPSLPPPPMETDPNLSGKKGKAKS